MKERIKKWLLSEQELMVLKSNPAGQLSYPTGQSGAPVARPNNPDAILGAMDFEVWVYVASNTIAKAMALAPLQAQKLKTIDGDRQWMPQEPGTPLFNTCTRPNDRETSAILIWRTFMALSTGTAYWIKDDTDKDKFYHISPTKMEAVPEQDGSVLKYIAKRGVDKVSLDADQVIQFNMPSVRSEYYGQSPIEPIKQEILMHKHYLTYLKNFFKNGAALSGALESEQQPNDLVIATTRAEWDRMHQGSDNAHKTAMLFGGLKFNPVSPPLKDLVAEMLYKMPREAIIAAFGLPPVLAGIFEFANYANSGAQLKLFWQYTVLPMQIVIASAINTQYVWPVFGDDQRVAFNNDAVEALQEDKKEKATWNKMLVDGGIWTANESRVRSYGMDPLDGGDELRRTQSVGSPPPDGDSAKSTAPQFKAITDADERKLIWCKHERTVKAFERGFASIIRKFFDEQIDRIVANLDKLALSNGKFNTGHLAGMLLKSDESDTLELFNLAFENALLETAVDPYANSVVRTAGQSAARSVGVGIAFDVKDPNVDVLIDLFKDRVTSVNLTSQKQILKILQDTYQQSESIAFAEKRMRTFYKDQSKMRATRTAITEMNGLTNGAAVIGYKQAGVEKLQWISAFLDTSRETHMDADGQVVNAGELFQVGDSAMAFPSDPRGLAEDTINCHCTVIAFVEDV